MLMSDNERVQTIDQQEAPPLGGDKYASEKPGPIRSQTTEMKLGNTTYVVTTTFNRQARETVEQKLLRLVTERISGEINPPKNSKQQELV